MVVRREGKEEVESTRPVLPKWPSMIPSYGPGNARFEQDLERVKAMIVVERLTQGPNTFLVVRGGYGCLTEQCPLWWAGEYCSGDHSFITDCPLGKRVAIKQVHP